MEDAQRTESIKNLVEHIDGSNIVLPEFQRDFVWDVEKTYDLFDSIVRDVFIGSLIYGIPSFEITVREIDDRPRRQQGKRRKSLKTFDFTKAEIDEKVKVGNFRLILDGQQRITSIYRAIKKVDNVWFIVKGEDELEVDVSLKPVEERNLEDILLTFTGQPDPNRLSINIADVWDIIVGQHKRESAKKDLLLKTEYGASVKSAAAANSVKFENLFDDYLVILDKLEDLFKAEKLISYYLLDTTQEKFALFFERSNSRGVRLNFVDILTAKLYGGFKLRDRTREFEDDNPDISLNLQIVVRCIAYIVSGQKRVAQAYILQGLNAEHFNEYWDTVCELYKKSLDWLHENHIVISQSWMPYENMLIPLIMFLKGLPGQDFSQMSENQRKFLIFWYWSSIFSQRYSSASNEIIIQDSNILSSMAVSSKVTDRSFFRSLRIQVTSKDDVLSLVKKQSAIYKGILNLLNYGVGGLIDWSNTSRLSFNSRLEDHHIFPSGYLRQKYKDNDEVLEYVDCVANRTLIPKLTNIKIGKKPPSVYLNELKLKNSRLVESLTNHRIPDPADFLDGLYDDFYDDFLDERAESIFQLVKVHVLDIQSQIRAEFLDEVVAKPDGISRNQIAKDEDLTGQKISSFSLFGKMYEADSWRTMLYKICQLLIEKHNDQFAEKATVLKGSKRHYITFNPADLRDPAQIDGTNLWLETNLSAQQTVSVISKLLDSFGHDKSSFIIYREI